MRPEIKAKLVVPVPAKKSPNTVMTRFSVLKVSLADLCSYEAEGKGGGERERKFTIKKDGKMETA